MTPQESLTLRVEHYMDLLRHLDPTVKLALIARLSESVVEARTVNDDIPAIHDLAGSWELDAGQTAEDLVDDIRKSRVFNRETGAL